MVPHVLGRQHEDDVLGDVGGVVTNPLEMTGHENLDCGERGELALHDIVGDRCIVEIGRARRPPRSCRPPPANPPAAKSLSDERRRSPEVGSREPGAAHRHFR